jgi:endo-1,4-beta-xylanase
MAQFPSVTTAIAAPTSLGLEASRKNMVFGMEIGTNSLAYATPFVLAQQAGLIVPGNDFKWNKLAPTTRNTYDFTLADTYAAFAAAHGIILKGHTIVWHSAQPAWLSGDAAPNGLVGATQSQARTLLYEYIDAVVGHFAGQVRYWDVANEAFNNADGQAGGYKNSNWFQAYGDGTYLRDAFVRAHAADPLAKLGYNDFTGRYNGTNNNADRANILAWLTAEVAAGTPIHYFGFQGHFQPAANGTFYQSGIATWFDQIAALGLEIWITELDCRDDDLAADITTRDAGVADRVQPLLDILGSRTAVKGVIQFATNDFDSFLNGLFPRGDGLPQRPVLFDASGQRKVLGDRMATMFQGAVLR